MSAVHLVQTVEEFAEWVAAEFGEGAVLHPSNRISACGRHTGNFAKTTNRDQTTCKNCLKASTR